MRALLAAVGTRGDVQPALALALELRKLGHAVRLCISPNFVDWAKSLGLEARTYLQQENYETAIETYLAQMASGDPTATNSLATAAAKALSVLTPDQRTKLAEHIRERSERFQERVN